MYAAVVNECVYWSSSVIIVFPRIWVFPVNWTFWALLSEQHTICCPAVPDQCTALEWRESNPPRVCCLFKSETLLGCKISLMQGLPGATIKCWRAWLQRLRVIINSMSVYLLATNALRQGRGDTAKQRLASELMPTECSSWLGRPTSQRPTFIPATAATNLCPDSVFGSKSWCWESHGKKPSIGEEKAAWLLNQKTGDGMFVCPVEVACRGFVTDSIIRLLGWNQRKGPTENYYRVCIFCRNKQAPRRPDGHPPSKMFNANVVLID